MKGKTQLVDNLPTIWDIEHIWHVFPRLNRSYARNERPQYSFTIDSIVNVDGQKPVYKVTMEIFLPARTEEPKRDRVSLAKLKYEVRMSKSLITSEQKTQIFNIYSFDEQTQLVDFVVSD